MRQSYIYLATTEGFSRVFIGCWKLSIDKLKTKFIDVYGQDTELFCFKKENPEVIKKIFEELFKEHKKYKNLYKKEYIEEYKNFLINI